jgi:hypothetical protein
MKKNRMIAALSGVFMLRAIWSHAYAQAVNLTGTWQVESDKDNGAIVLKMNQSGILFPASGNHPRAIPRRSRMARSQDRH